MQHRIITFFAAKPQQIPIIKPNDSCAGAPDPITLTAERQNITGGQVQNAKYVGKVIFQQQETQNLWRLRIINTRYQVVFCRHISGVSSGSIVKIDAKVVICPALFHD